MLLINDSESGFKIFIPLKNFHQEFLSAKKEAGLTSP